MPRENPADNDDAPAKKNAVATNAVILGFLDMSVPSTYLTSAILDASFPPSPFHERR